jgi:putative ABC transport system ATP-binding protein
MSIIKFENVTKIYQLGKTQVVALKNINLEINEAEFTGIIGPSGSGKTTLLNLAGCIDIPTEGKIFIDGKDITHMDEKQLTFLRREKIGFIFQTFNLIPVLTVFENVELPLIALGVNKEDRYKMVMEMLENVGIKDLAFRKPEELSGGQRQRVAIARALVKKPKIVLADEPTANLDSETGTKIVELMKYMDEKFNTTFVISTHDPRLLNFLEKKVYLVDGKIDKIE